MNERIRKILDWLPYWILWFVLVFPVLLFIIALPLCFGHETEKYQHQTGSFMRYGGNYIGAGIYRTWVNAEHTQCRDTIFNHNKSHITEPFDCNESLERKES